MTSLEKMTAPQFYTSRLADQKLTPSVTVLWSFHPNINLSVIHGLIRRLNFVEGITPPHKIWLHLCIGFSRNVMEKIALWLRKCLLMQLMTRKSGLQLLMATG